MSNILIVGANQGIGYWMVSSFLEKGNKVTVLDIREEHINELKDKYPNSLLVVKADATDEASLSDGIKAAINKFGMVDIAIHNACLCTFESEPDTASSSGLPVPKEFMADAEKVGRGLANHIYSKKFVICHSFNQALQMKLCYSHPLYMGKMMWKMTQRTKS